LNSTLGGGDDASKSFNVMKVPIEISARKSAAP
jgi:hypothetical protein